jgi:DNA-binding transcriptional LysR family regulator
MNTDMAAVDKHNRVLYDLDLLRAIVMVADCGSFTAAAAKLHSTQSTISQKIQRLEEQAGHRLLERGSRSVQPTDAGETLLGYARRMLSLNDEMREALAGAAVAVTIRMLAAFSRKHPQVKLEITSGLSRDLSDRYDTGELDLVLLKHRRNSREAVAAWPETLRWIDSRKNPSASRDPVPLVAFPPRGLYRGDMINALERNGRRWRISFTTSSLNGIQAAVADGLGISILPARAVTSDHIVLGSKEGFAPVSNMEVALLYRPSAEPAVRELAAAFDQMLSS